MISYATVPTPVGVIGVLGDGAAITQVGWSIRPPVDAVSDALADEAAAQLRAYFAGDLERFDLPIELGVQTAATGAVLRALYETVGHGETVTYGELAVRSGTDIPARGIGAIMGANPLPIIVPCHRVVAGSGLGGYSGGPPGQGLQTKRWLLEHERALPAALF